MNDGFFRLTFTITLIYEKNNACEQRPVEMLDKKQCLERDYDGRLLSLESQSLVDVVVFTHKTL